MVEAEEAAVVRDKPGEVREEMEVIARSFRIVRTHRRSLLWRNSQPNASQTGWSIKAAQRRA